jgi:hypothetical protein
MAKNISEPQEQSDTVNAFFKEHRLPPEEMELKSGPVEISKFSWRFRPWSGKAGTDTYGGKAVVDCNGFPVFAELAIISALKQHGFDGGVWVDSYRKCFRNAMPPAVCKPPKQVVNLYETIATQNGKPSGCWDVLAWNNEGVTFVECKRKKRDRITENEANWLESALKVGIPLEKFIVCEWELE